MCAFVFFNFCFCCHFCSKLQGDKINYKLHQNTAASTTHCHQSAPPLLHFQQFKTEIIITITYLQTKISSPFQKHRQTHPPYISYQSVPFLNYSTIFVFFSVCLSLKQYSSITSINLLMATTQQQSQQMGCKQSQKDTDAQGFLTKPHIYFLLGGPGSGKDTQAENLIQDYKFKHLSTGQLLRMQKEKGGELAKTIETYMREGKLLPSSLVVDLLEEGIKEGGNRRYLFNGFPRNRENWQQFQKRLADKVVIRDLIYFDCPPETLVARMTERCKNSARPDDNADAISKRIATYQNQTIPAISEFRVRNNCLTVDATLPKQQVNQQLRNKLTEANILPPAPVQMLFVLGGPGSGKGTQCAILVKKYGFIHLSTGDLLREQIKTGSQLGKEIDAVIREGKLVSSELMVRLVQETIERNNYAGRYLLDGFPRGQENMDVWERVMAKSVHLRSVIYFDSNKEELKRRLLQRGKTSGRSDDNEESISKRLDAFEQYTKPVEAFYEKSGKLQRFDANREITSITHDLQVHLDGMGIFPSA